MEKRKQQGYF